MNISLIDDISTLTRVDVKLLQKLSNVGRDAFLHQLMEMENQQTKQIDIGIGIISVQREDDELIFNFEPAQYIYDHIFDIKSPLEVQIEDKFTKKILSTYKELM